MFASCLPLHWAQVVRRVSGISTNFICSCNRAGRIQALGSQLLVLLSAAGLGLLRWTDWFHKWWSFHFPLLKIEKKLQHETSALRFRFVGFPSETTHTNENHLPVQRFPTLRFRVARIPGEKNNGKHEFVELGYSFKEAWSIFFNSPTLRFCVFNDFP